MQEVLTRMQTTLKEAAVQAYERLMEILPEAVLAIGIVIIGWFVSAVLHFVTKRILCFFAVDKLAGKTPLDKVLKSIGIHKSIVDIIALLVFWMAVLVTLVFASEVLHLEQVSDALAVVTRYIPQVIAAILIIIFGMLLARFLQVLVTQAVRRMELGYEQTAGKVVNIVVLVFVFLAAVDQLGLELSFITTNALIFLAALLIIIGVALVVSARGVLENWMACRQLQSHLSVGDHIENEHLNGTVKEFTQTTIIIAVQQGETVVPASLLLKHTYTRRSSHADG